MVHTFPYVDPNYPFTHNTLTESNHEGLKHKNQQQYSAEYINAALTSQVPGLQMLGVVRGRWF